MRTLGLNGPPNLFVFLRANVLTTHVHRGTSTQMFPPKRLHCCLCNANYSILSKPCINQDMIYRENLEGKGSLCHNALITRAAVLLSKGGRTECLSLREDPCRTFPAFMGTGVQSFRLPQGRVQGETFLGPLKPALAQSTLFCPFSMSTFTKSNWYTWTFPHLTLDQPCCRYGLQTSEFTLPPLHPVNT